MKGKGVTIALEVSPPLRWVPSVDRTALQVSFIWLWFAFHLVNYGHNHLLNDLTKRRPQTEAD